MKRWVAAIVAVLFLSTATMHVFSHVGEDAGICATCHVQQAGAISAPAPRVVSVPVPAIALPEVQAPRAVSIFTAPRSARAPPAVPA